MVTAAPEMTTGRKKAARQNERRKSGRLSTQARASATTIWSGRWIARNTSVLTTACQKRVSPIRRSTLSSPAKPGAVTRSHSMPTRTTENAMGNSANRSRNAV